MELLTHGFLVDGRKFSTNEPNTGGATKLTSEHLFKLILSLVLIVLHFFLQFAMSDEEEDYMSDAFLSKM